ncbi:MAG: TIGR02452 family protein [Planctomycetaceae bacterium]|nr:TIGR02452 family protein [Planctomycetaceae bacterium]
MKAANRNDRSAIAQETLAIVEKGFYLSPLGRRVDLGPMIEESQQGTELLRPQNWAEIHAAAQAVPQADHPTMIEVTAETTLAAARRLSCVPGSRVLALNFASAKNPGGGFLGGSQAQEESLARASGLYPCLLKCPEYYQANRTCGTLLYTDHAIYSPSVPVFRDDEDQLIEEPFVTSFVTMPAPNIGAMRAGSLQIADVEGVLRQRVDHVLALAVARGYSHLVLGAWGCGVFGNDPAVVAKAFEQSLITWGTRVKTTTFAIFDTIGHTREVFARQLAPEQQEGRP